MSRPNFFCNTNTLKYLAQMEYSDDHEAIDISVDCIELPFWLLFSSDEENYYLKLIKRYEIFWHDENMSVIISELTANKTTGEASLKTYDTGDEFLSMIIPVPSELSSRLAKTSAFMLKRTVWTPNSET